MKNILALSFFVFVFALACKEKEELPDPYQAGWKGEKVCEILEDNPQYRILKCTFLPGVGHESHYHKPHFGYTLKGSKFRIIDAKGTHEYDLPSGYSFSNSERIEHEVLNIGDSTAVFLIFEPK